MRTGSSISSLFAVYAALLLVSVATVVTEATTLPSNALAVRAWPTAAAYALTASDHTLRVCSADAHIRARGGALFTLLPLASLALRDVEDVADHADALLRSLATRREMAANGTTVTVDATIDVLYRAELDAAECVYVNLPSERAGIVALFTEFEASQVQTTLFDATALVPVLQCITGCTGADAPATALAAVDATDSSSWMSPVAASLLISLTSIAGVVVLSFDKGRVEAIVEYMTSFGAGCLLGVVVFHLYPEGTGYLADAGHWVMGACVLGGIVFSMAVETGVHGMLAAFGVDHCDESHSHGHHPHHDHATMDTLSETDRLTLSPESQSPGGHSHASHHIDVREPLSHSHSHSPRASERDLLVKPHDGHNHGHSHGHSHDHSHGHSQTRSHINSLAFVDPVAWITAVGDFFHAFTDGVVLAVAFKSCSASLGWAVALGIVLHEVPHRVGDFFIFIKAGLAIPHALVLNFAASMASLLGVVILLATGDVSRHTLGVLLGVGTGALLFIGLTELLPPMLAVRDRGRLSLHFFWFSLGCVLIGLSVLQDTHCHV